LKRACGLVLLALLALLTVQKVQGGVGAEMLWVCHVTAAMLALGLLFELPLLVAAGFLFHIAVAVPTYALHLATGGDSSAVSFALHVAAPVLGWIAWRGRPLPAAAPWLALGTYLGLMMVCRFATPGGMNINLAYHPWGPFAALGVWPGRLLNVALMLAQLGAARMLWNRFLAKDLRQ
jgi:hypothetical protein